MIHPSLWWVSRTFPGVDCLARHQKPEESVFTSMIFRVNILLDRQLPGGELWVSARAYARFNAKMNRQLRELQKQMQQKYPTPIHRTDRNRCVGLN